MKQLLIISPYFPPCNAADMQRVRMSLPYFAAHGWEAEVVAVDPDYADIVKDELLTESLPPGIKIHRVKAFDKKWTAKLGLGSIALRSLFYYRKKVNALLKAKQYDLIYFSTTQFPVCVLGAYWKKRFNIPYVIDMQDPWHSDYYQGKPRDLQPKKYWFSYHLNKYLEPVAIKNSDGLIAVSDRYINDLKKRYPRISAIPSSTITFGAFEPDLQIAARNAGRFKPILYPGFKNIVYIGRGGNDMHKALIPLFEALKLGLATEQETFQQIKLYFIGTSYAAIGRGEPTVLPLAEKYGILDNVIEVTDRISYYHTLCTLQQADALFIPGSDDPKYTASKIYTYMSVPKPLLTIFNKESSAIGILKQYGITRVYNYDDVSPSDLMAFLIQLVKGDLLPDTYNAAVLSKYSAETMTLNQCNLFNRVIVSDAP